MLRALCLCLIAALWSTALPGTSQAGAFRGVVELYTSQGCSSCPPADAVFEELKSDKDLITLSLPVDYWDRLGWKDTFGSPAHAARQRSYAQVRGDGAVYTPQAVVNGRSHMNGAHRDQILQTVAEMRGGLTVPVRMTREGGDVVIEVGRGGPAAPVEPSTVLLLPYLDSRVVAVGRGENAKRTLTYTNIVRRIDKLGTFTGETMRDSIPLTSLSGVDGVVVLVQAGTADAPGPILGAGRLALK